MTLKQKWYHAINVGKRKKQSMVSSNETESDFLDVRYNVANHIIWEYTVMQNEIEIDAVRYASQKNFCYIRVKRREMY